MDIARRALLWFARDLRLGSNPAVELAMEHSAELLPVYANPEATTNYWAPGRASREWLYASLRALDGQLMARGSALAIHTGDPDTALVAYATQHGVRDIYTALAADPVARQAQRQVCALLERQGYVVHLAAPNLLVPDSRILTGQGRPYQKYTPYYNRVQPFADAAAQLVRTRSGSEVRFLPQQPDNSGWARLGAALGTPAASGLTRWEAGEQAARRKLEQFTANQLCSYEAERDLITAGNVSQLSPHLHFGEIDIHSIYRTSRECAAEHPACAQGAASFQRQLIWREFTHYLLAHHPHLGHEPLDPDYANFPWGWDTELFTRWRDGQTGYPVIDAAMRQLAADGWMPNRARMLVASFLIKHLLVHWQLGAAWFWERLVDADLPNNSFGWQWAAGCGADAAPYFRIFNPVTQSQKFDPDGEYIRHFVPELATLPPRLIHFPARCDAGELARHAPGLWQRYPRPIVAHADARERALATFQRFKQQLSIRS